MHICLLYIHPRFFSWTWSRWTSTKRHYLPVWALGGNGCTKVRSDVRTIKDAEIDAFVQTIQEIKHINAAQMSVQQLIAQSSKEKLQHILTNFNPKGETGRKSAAVLEDIAHCLMPSLQELNELKDMPSELYLSAFTKFKEAYATEFRELTTQSAHVSHRGVADAVDGMVKMKEAEETPALRNQLRAEAETFAKNKFDEYVRVAQVNRTPRDWDVEMKKGCSFW